MQILSDAAYKQVPQRLRSILNFFLGSVGSHHVVYFFKVFLFGEQIGHLTSVEDIIYILQEGVVDDLHVCEYKGQLFALASSHFCYLLQITPK